MNSTLKRSLTAVLLVSRWFGVAPVKWYSHEPRVSMAFKMYGTMLICFLVTITLNETVPVIIMIIKREISLDHENLLDIFKLLNVAVKELPVFIFASMTGSQRMTVVFEILNQLEKIMEKRMKKTPERKIFYYLIIIILVAIAILQINKFILFIYNSEKDILSNTKMFLILFILHFGSSVPELHFVIIALLIHTLLSNIHEDLEQLFKENVSPAKMVFYKKQCKLPVHVSHINPTIDSFGLNTEAVPDSIPNNTKREIIRSISRSYVFYCSLVKKLNDSVDILLFLCLFKLGTSIAMKIIGTINIGNLSADATRIAIFFHFTIWTLVDGTKLMLLVEPSYRAQFELRHIYLLVSKALIQTGMRKELEQINELRHFLKMLHLNKPVYNAFGVFRLGRPLIIGVLSGIVTIMVILFV